jgi:DNA-binding transcriptional MerR regulator
LTLEYVPGFILLLCNMHNDQKPLRSGELARRAGVSTDTLRHYERMSLLARPPRTAAGYRQYPASALDRVQLVRRALAVGFGLRELAVILRERDRGGAPCRAVRSLAESRLRQIERQLADLKAIRNRLRAVLADWDRRLASTPKGRPARLLESLADLPRRS